MKNCYSVIVNGQFDDHSSYIRRDELGYVPVSDISLTKLRDIVSYILSVEGITGDYRIYCLL